MYTLKTIVRRSSALGMAAALLVAAVMPAAAVLAQQALNPLTERSLLLSSSAPGYIDTDGSGYSEASKNPAGDGDLGAPGTTIPYHFAPAGSGPNGMKTGQTFTFKTSTNGADIRGFSFQYCTLAAGYCQAPGDNTGDARTVDRYDDDDPSFDPEDEDTWEPRVADRQANTGTGGGHENSTSDLDFVNNFVEGTGAGTFEVVINGVTSTGWSFTKANLEDVYYADPELSGLTGKNNYVTLSAATPTAADDIPGGTEIQVIFRPSETVYITNPGSGSFFVKINTYSSHTSLIGSHNDGTPHNYDDAPGHTVIDGGVTVANVMTDSIHITTKVLETMAFSVGTRNRDTVELVNPQVHGTCDAIQQENNNRLQLGNPNAEYSLETGRGYDVYSYWRLSSNSSGGATVYYSGNTLANTVGDEIADMPTAGQSTPGTEQFGLGFVDAGSDTLSSSFLAQQVIEPTRFKTPTSFPFITLTGQNLLTTPDDFTALAAQPISTDYRSAAGTLDDGAGGAGTAVFKFVKTSLTVPEPIAQQNETVISCATAKMRYVGNIAADTPAGVYTTKVNYLAAPQY